MAEPKWPSDECHWTLLIIRHLVIDQQQAISWASIDQGLCPYHGLVQDCSNSIANTLELLQSCTKPTKWCHYARTGLWIRWNFLSNVLASSCSWPSTGTALTTKKERIFSNHYSYSLISAWTKWPPVLRRYFRMHFREWKVLYFDWNFTELCFWGSNWQ